MTERTDAATAADEPLEEPPASPADAASVADTAAEPAAGDTSPAEPEAGESDPAEVADQVPSGAAPPEEDEPEDLVAAKAAFPDLTEDAALDAALEAVLLVVDAPAEDEVLATAVDQGVARVRTALRRLSARYTEQGSGIDLRRVGAGWRFYTRDRYAPVVEKLLLDGQRAKLTRAALETLAVIAYRQPVTRARVAAVRGVNVDGVIRTLVVRGLIEETGTDSETGGILYRTTELFLERLGLSSLEDLPPIAPLLPEVDAIDDV
ncbi:SMC-Scp complex subunit ScpB [Actinokineospora iranica]|uniref:Segregation and condensation protein B n=1 Tax=Actinokineospora iranica TaxID=1271860 RepID=A0A1G6XFW3_9PSEU|nr:SMC-Scp complex subunit ScpB [Actinokineospora iranica]SDD77060.1 segregation and condensation protein B [Actinokineospora iranica]